MSLKTHTLLKFAAYTVTISLAACANITSTPPGSALSEVTAQHGAPNYSCTTSNGTQRVIWTMQPLGQYAWGANVDSNGNIDQVVPLLTNQNFRKLDKGVWSEDDLRCEFGPPAEIAPVGLPSVRRTVWSYRYKENGAWNSLMHVYFDPETNTVEKYHSGPDPIYENERFWFF